MKRRNFLRGLFGMAAAATVAPLAKLLPVQDAWAKGWKPTEFRGAPFVIDATIGQYADYISISDLSMDASLDPALVNLSKELSYRLAATLDQLCMNQHFHASLAQAGYRVDHRAVARFKRSIRKDRYIARQSRRRARMAA